MSGAAMSMPQDPKAAFKVRHCRLHWIQRWDLKKEGSQFNVTVLI